VAVAVLGFLAQGLMVLVVRLEPIPQQIAVLVMAVLEALAE
jgi:hypothetical protein